MSLPAVATKVHLDASSDDPSQARAELVALIDKFNALLSALPTDFATAAQGTLATNAQPAATAINTGNIGSQSVNYATSAGSATTATNASGTGTIPVTGESGLRVVRGSVNYSTLGLYQGAGFTVANPTQGNYTITFLPAFSARPTIVVSAGNAVNVAGGWSSGGSTTYITVTQAGNPMNADFSIIAIGPN